MITKIVDLHGKKNIYNMLILIHIVDTAIKHNLFFHFTKKKKGWGGKLCFVKRHYKRKFLLPNRYYMTDIE